MLPDALVTYVPDRTENEMSIRRRRVRPHVESEVLVESRRRCALCYGLDGDVRRKQGQIAHVDRDPSNSAKPNLAWLCLEHHNEYDTRPSQGKRLTPAELIQFRDQLVKAVAAGEIVVADVNAAPSRSRGRQRAYRRISLEVYDRRIVIYRACRDYLNAIVREADINTDSIHKLARETEEAIFLFDEASHEYIVALIRKGLALRREHLRSQRRTEAIHPDVTWATFEAALDLLLQEAETVRQVFKPYLHL